MIYDVNVRKIVNFLHSEHNVQWSRDVSRPRILDGITLLTEGCIEYRFEHKTLTARAGDLVFLSGNPPYSGKKLSDRVSFYVVNFECATSEEFERIGAPSVVTVDDFKSIEQEMATTLDMWNKQPIEAPFAVKGLVYRLLCHAVHDCKPERRVSGTERILEHIMEHLGDPSLSIKKLCAEFYISESQLRRNVQKATGLKPNEYLLKLRLQKAQNELLHTDKAIKRIAEECGFASPYYFSRCFSEHLHTSPKEYRKKFDV